MTYAQELLAQGEERGKVKNQVEVIERLLREGMEWPAIERVMGLNEAEYQALKQQVEDMNE